MRTPNGLVVEVSDKVGRLMIDRQDRMNALSSPIQVDLLEALDDFATNDDVWMVVLTGAGSKSFCAGIDLRELQAQQGPGLLGSRHPMDGVRRNVFEAVLDFPKPTLAAINGYAVGGGMELALACDLRLASSTALLSLPEVKRGLAGHFGSQLLPRLIPRGIAFELLYFGDFIDMDRALQFGLVNAVYEPEELHASVNAYCARLLQGAPLTLRRYKAALTAGLDTPLAAALRLRVSPDPYASTDRLEGIAAFVEGRDPVWRNE